MNKTRINILFFFLLLLSFILSFRLYQLQIVEADHWSKRAERQQKVTQRIEGDRGSIFAENKSGETIPLAIDRTWKRIYISPRKIIEKEVNKGELVNSLSSILNIKKDFINKKLADQDSAYKVIKSKISEEEIKKIKQLKFPGIHLEDQEERYYPQQKLAANVIGFVGGMGQGQYGIEGYYNDILKGRPGIKQGRRTPGGVTVLNSSAQTGMSIDLTIDYNIQFMAEDLIKEYVKKWDAKSGTVVVANPKTGAIKAIANYPSFNPNNYQKFSLSRFKNNAVQSLFEPGSVFKPLVMAAALEEGAVSPEDTYMDKGVEKVSGYSLRNYHQAKYGLVTMTEILEKSINTGMVHVQQQMKDSVFVQYLEDYGLFEETGIDLQGEAASKNLSFKEGYAVNYANAAFGQGIRITPIQLVSVFSALANGGEWVKPYLAKNFNPSPTKRRVLSSSTTTTITSMLISTVEEGTAKRAKIPGYYIAGKTGTAQVPWSVLGKKKAGYSNETIQSFIGYGPLDAEFLILVKMNQPEAPTAEVSVVPLFRELAEYIIEYKQIPPDYVREKE